ncbi:MAG: hypothetical protein N4J56_007740 [Chroococcidiopsis sp. SAG 2025]|uniref:M20/M25/M40 family metallo-hydrolase n=1 Tax=Chroococcidiopsis sp. SAG 2025 TaxID=171389 RepID=UPI002936D6CD|nr:M20/M25/M40 family metallo-hydrolase [Chroococcidiopsis sp. SAG 2025]MDV2998035.1 hypothetical protein [Chroococcidiopsis sp. SAG 2025]
MNGTTTPIVFFDIGDTLGTPRISPPPYRLEGLDIYPYIPDILQQLKDKNVQIGIISNTGDETEDDMKRVLEEAGIYNFFKPNLLIYSSAVGIRKPSPEIFQLAAERSGYATAPEHCFFVGEDSKERKSAVNEGWRVVPHPLLVWEVLDGKRLKYIRVSAPVEQSEQEWRSAVRGLPIVPLYVTGEKGNQVYAIATTQAAMRLDDLGFAVDRLGSEDDPLTTEVYLLRDDLQKSTGFLNPQGGATQFFANDEPSKMVLASSTEGLFVALPGDHSVEDYHFDKAQHGHNLKLLPDPSLLEPFGEGNNARTASFLQTPSVEPSLSQAELDKFTAITPEKIRGYLERYVGIKPLNDDEQRVNIKSRHIHSSDMPLVTEALAQDLKTIGGEHFSVRMDRFVHEGRELYNVEAELQGSASKEIVLVTAHLDSTAASDAPFDTKNDPAPGADDDASGVASVLAIAEVIKELVSLNLPKRTIRFVLFNAEEHGLVGSQAYARTQAAKAAPLVGVYQMDMVGYNVNSPRSFEVHVGYAASADVEERSLVLAQRLERLVSTVSPTLERPQIYTQPDPAEGRSDHASFHQRGYAACVTSEDFFVGPDPASPNAEPNPNYHREGDTFVDFDYAADIARVVGAAAWVTANA